jgi:energy-coupling factor transporter transmembrane protein EcfT
MKNQKLIILALLLLISQSALAHGEEVLIPLFIEFVGMIIVFVIVALIRFKIVGKLLLVSIYIISTIIIIILTFNIPYRDNKIVIDISSIGGPIALTIAGYLIFKNKYQKT